MTVATRVVTVWCPDWPVVAAAWAAAPGTPVAVVVANRVVACSAAAREEGVQRGLRRRQAEARCPGLLVVAPDLGREARAFEPVVAAVEAFAPHVEIVRPGLCVFATRGPSRYFGGDEALATHAVAQVDEVLAATLGDGAPAPAPGCRAGVADGHFASEQAARQAILVVPPGGSAAFLAPFPVASLAAELDDLPDLPDLLSRLGVRTIGEFAALPAKAVLARFGPAGARAHRLARGLDARPVAARVPAADLTVVAELDPPAEHLDTVAFVARSLAARLHDALAAQGMALGRVRVEAETEHGESLSRTWRVDGGAAALAERVRWQLDGWLSAPGETRPTGPLVLLRLVPEEVTADGGRQEGFWGGDRASADRAARAFERVQGRLGPDSVVTGVIGGGRGPAEQVTLIPWGDPSPSPSPSPSQSPSSPTTAPSPWPGRLPSPAPATVPLAPVPATVVDASGALVSVCGRGIPTAAPASVAVAGRPPSRVVAWAGPWPVDERWWDPHGHRRRARWQVVTADGAAHLLVLEGGVWFVEATYD